MITFKGKLEFISFWNPIRLITKNGELDLRTDYFRIFSNLNGKKTTIDYGMNHIKISADENSDSFLEYENKSETILILLKRNKGFGFSNLGAYVPDILQRLNGMQVIVEFDNEYISICHDETETVYEINYTEGNSCKIPDDKVKELCKIGEVGCCIFVTVGSNGFMCEKFSSTARTLLDRYSKGNMRASRIGNCKIIGRIEEKIK